MRLRTVTPAVALLLAGCGSATGSTTATASASASPAVPWMLYQSGNTSPPATLASLSPPATVASGGPLPSTTTCALSWPTDEQVLIPMIVTPGVRSLKVQWPSWYGPVYRVTAVDQRLVTGTQPPPTWTTVTAGAGCTVTATLTGLISGNPYVVWLDAPDTPRHPDNSRSLYSGRSGIVKPL